MAKESISVKTIIRVTVLTVAVIMMAAGLLDGGYRDVGRGIVFMEGFYPFGHDPFLSYVLPCILPFLMPSWGNLFIF